MSSPQNASTASSPSAGGGGAGTPVSPLGISVILLICSGLLLAVMGWQTGAWQESARTQAILTQARAVADAVSRIDTSTEAGEALLQSRLGELKKSIPEVGEALVLEGTRFVAHTNAELAGSRLSREDLGHKALYDDARALQEGLERNREERKTYADLNHNPFPTSILRPDGEQLAVAVPVVAGTPDAPEMRGMVVLKGDPGRFPASPLATQLSLAAAALMGVAFVLGRMGNRALVSLVGLGWMAVAGFLLQSHVQGSTRLLQEQVGKAAAQGFVTWTALTQAVPVPEPVVPAGEPAVAPVDPGTVPDPSATPVPTPAPTPVPAPLVQAGTTLHFLTAINQDGDGNRVEWVQQVQTGGEAPATAIRLEATWAQPGPALVVGDVWAWRGWGVAAGFMLLYLGLLLTGRTARISKGFMGSWYAYAYIAPAVIGTTVLVFGPFLFGIMLGFYTRVYNSYEFVGLQNFAQILSDFNFTQTKNFYRTLGVTILWTVTNVSLHVSIGLGLAMLLKDKSLRFTPLYRTLLVIPWALPNYITALIWKGMFNKEYGAVNAALTAIGIEPVSWFNSFSGAFFANLVTNVWLGFPFMMVISLGALQSIPADLYEAADVDGAGAWDKFTRITLPLLKPALFPAVILGSIWTFNQFNVIYLVSAGAPDGETDILITEAYRWAFEGRQQYGYAAAYSTIIFVILFGYTAITNKITKSTEGAYA